jgi:hypothetical protein
MAFLAGGASMTFQTCIRMTYHPKTFIACYRLSLPTMLAFLLAGSGCGKKEAPGPGTSAAPTMPTPPPQARPAVVSAEKTSFNEITAQLDPGGSLYGYLNTSQWLEGLSDRINGWREAVLSLPNLGSEEKSNLGKAFDLITRLIRNSGIESINGVGVSGIALEKGFYQTKLMVGRDTGSPPKGIWTLFGRAPRPLQELDWLPADTVWASFADVDLATVWKGISNEVDQSGFAEAKAGLAQVNGVVQMATGKNLDEIFGSLGGQCGAFLRLNASNKISIPRPDGGTIDIPEPGLVFVLKVKDDTIFDWIDRALKDNPQVISSTEGGLRMRTMPIPLPLPVALRPTVGREGEYLFIASNDELIKNMMAVKAGKLNGLKTGAEFKRLAQGMPTEGNSFSFVSQRLGETMRELQSSFLGQMHNQGSDAPTVLLQKISSINQPTTSFMVSRSTEQGWLTVGHGSQQPANIVILPLVVVPSAVVAGLALPALAKAKSKAQSIACVNNLKQMGLAALLYANDHNNTYPSDFLTMKDQLGNPKTLICPSAPNHAISATLTWASFDPAQSSYDYVTRGLKDSTPGPEKKVVFRCRIHGHVCFGDGHVEMKNSN